MTNKSKTKVTLIIGYDDKWPSCGGDPNGHVGLKGWDTKEDRFDHSHASLTNTAYSNVRVTNVSGARTSGETRPKNIRVVYIMKVF